MFRPERERLPGERTPVACWRGILPRELLCLLAQSEFACSKEKFAWQNAIDQHATSVRS